MIIRNSNIYIAADRRLCTQLCFALILNRLRKIHTTQTKTIEFDSANESINYPNRFTINQITYHHIYVLNYFN